MRTNTVIGDKLLKATMNAAGPKTKRTVMEQELQTLLRQ